MDIFGLKALITVTLALYALAGLVYLLEKRWGRR